jgi:hypothetical protein
LYRVQVEEAGVLLLPALEVMVVTLEIMELVAAAVELR